MIAPSLPILAARVQLDLVDHGADVTAYAEVREGRTRYVYQVDVDRGAWYRRERSGDVLVDRGEVAIVVSPALCAAAEAAARALREAG